MVVAVLCAESCLYSLRLYYSRETLLERERAGAAGALRVSPSHKREQPEFRIERGRVHSCTALPLADLSSLQCMGISAGRKERETLLCDALRRESSTSSLAPTGTRVMVMSTDWLEILLPEPKSVLMGSISPLSSSLSLSRARVATL